MKKKSLCYITIVPLLIFMAGCKNNSLVSWFEKGPDSLYVGKKYVIERPFRFPQITNKYADSLTFEGVELGRRLFFDKHLSADGGKSCASCHLLQYALSDSGNAKSSNETGLTKRNAPALQNLLWNSSFFWDGKLGKLDVQANDATHNELAMNTDITISYLKADDIYSGLFKKAFGRPGDITEYKIDKALQQFMLTMISCNSKFDRFKKGGERLTEAEQRGFNIFSTDTGGCFRCHNSNGGYTLLLTDSKFRNNGLDSVDNAYQYPDSGRGGVTHTISDYGKFKVPSLRNVALTGPYMHDGRFKTLQQVVDFYSDGTRLSPSVDPIILFLFKGKEARHFTLQQKMDLVAFLSTFTDSSFIQNKALSDPFVGVHK